MGIERFFVRPVTILHPNQLADSYNNQLDDWDNATSTTTDGWLDQTRTQEVLGNRDAQLVDAILFLPAETTITAKDRVLVGGATYEVNGTPNECWTPRGLHHLECPLSEVTG